MLISDEYNMPSNDPVLIIGAGITGLGSGYYLKKLGIPSLVLESNSQVGGRAGFIKKGDQIFEIGGKNLNESWPHMKNLLMDLRIDEFEPQHRQANILIKNKLLQIPFKLGPLDIFNLVSILGIRGVMQLAKLMHFIKKNNKDINYQSNFMTELEKRDNIPISKQFVRSLSLGPLRMFSIITGCAEPDETYFSNLVLNLRYQGKNFSIRGSIIKLFQALENELNIRKNIKCTSIEIKSQRVTGVYLSGINGREYIPTANVIVALPAHQLERLIKIPEEIINSIRKIRYFPVIIINAIYDRNVFSEKINSLMFSPEYHLSHCSANRHNKLDSVRFTLSGRKAREIMNEPNEKLILLAEKEFNNIIPISAKRIDYHIQRHEPGVCAYGPQYSQIRKQILEYVQSIKGLEIAGDYLEGHNMEGCLTASYNAVERMILQLKT
jgi:protoporphyrinogen/coproporphyrinogen III oxidase